MIYHDTYILNFMRCAILTLGGKAFSGGGEWHCSQNTFYYIYMYALYTPC